MPDTEMQNFLDGVIGAVEANSYEYLCLWEEYHDRKGVAWVQNTLGYGQTVGQLADMPVFVSLNTAVVHGQKILFYEPTSTVVDFRMVEKWLLDNLPETAKRDGTPYLNKVDAMNFHNVFRTPPVFGKDAG